MSVSSGLPLQIEDIVTHIQDETEGVPIRTVKSFMTKIPSVVTGKNYIYNYMFVCLFVFAIQKNNMFSDLLS